MIRNITKSINAMSQAQTAFDVQSVLRPIEQMLDDVQKYAAEQKNIEGLIGLYALRGGITACIEVSKRMPKEDGNIKAVASVAIELMLALDQLLPSVTPRDKSLLVDLQKWRDKNAGK